MSDTNFHLAPAPKSVDGLLAVPIDIQRITAVLTFDGATQTGQGDATLGFTVGPRAATRAFDARVFNMAITAQPSPSPSHSTQSGSFTCKPT